MSTQLSAVPWPTAPPGASGLKVGFPEARHFQSPVHRFSHRTMIVLLAIGLGILTALLVLVAVLASPGPTPPCPVLKCQGPPIHRPGKDIPTDAAGPAVETGNLYEGDGYTLRYPSDGSNLLVSRSSDSVSLTYEDLPDGGTGSLDVLGGATSNATPASLVNQIAQTDFPNGELIYQLPDPLVGYEPAVGGAYNVQAASADGSTQTDRILVTASVENGFGIVALALGSLTQPITPSSALWDGHPSPANLNVAYFVGDDIVNSITWPSSSTSLP